MKHEVNTGVFQQFETQTGIVVPKIAYHMRDLISTENDVNGIVPIVMPGFVERHYPGIRQQPFQCFDDILSLYFIQKDFPFRVNVQRESGLYEISALALNTVSQGLDLELGSKGKNEARTRLVGAYNAGYCALAERIVWSQLGSDYESIDNSSISDDPDLESYLKRKTMVGWQAIREIPFPIAETIGMMLDNEVENIRTAIPQEVLPNVNEAWDTQL